MLKKLILKPKQIPQIPGLKAAEAPIAWDNATWKNEAYLRGRAPIPINSNYWVLFKNNKNTGNLLLLKKPPPKGVFSDSQFSRSTQLINNLFNFKQLVNENLLTPDTSPNGEPLCMKQYHELFNSCRIPNNGLDLFHSNPKIYGDQNDYIIVMAKDQMYKLKLTTSNGERVSLKELKRIMLQVGNDCLSTTPQPAIGLLTAGNRDTWAAAYKKLSTLSPQNAQNLETIKNSLFVVCLDDYSTISNPDIANLQMLHNFDGSNRWFDKPIQLLVANNGRAGVNAEHTPVDAMVAGRAFNYILENEPAIDPIQTEKSEFLDPPEKLIWTIDESIEKSIQESKSVIKALADDTVSIILSSTIYGSRFIKEIANASPDSYVQLVFQIVWNRLHGPTPPTAIYESAMTRQYEDGRTENIRSLSKDSWDFATAFDNDNVLYDDKRELFRKAIATHRNTIKEAVSGNGIDRYLLFLSLDPTQTFQQTPEYKSMMNFQLATSNATFPNSLIYGGFGPLVRDNSQPGYGINYSIDRDGINLSLSGKKTGKTDVYEFRRVFEQVLKDMMILFPKRSQIWGMGWEKKQEDEKKETAYFNSMKRASDEYLIKKQKLYEKLEKEKENASR